MKVKDLIDVPDFSFLGRSSKGFHINNLEARVRATDLIDVPDLSFLNQILIRTLMRVRDLIDVPDFSFFFFRF